MVNCLESIDYAFRLFPIHKPIERERERERKEEITKLISFYFYFLQPLLFLLFHLIWVIKIFMFFRSEMMSVIIEIEGLPFDPLESNIPLHFTVWVCYNYRGWIIGAKKFRYFNPESNLRGLIGSFINAIHRIGIEKGIQNMYINQDNRIATVSWTRKVDRPLPLQ